MRWGGKRLLVENYGSEDISIGGGDMPPKQTLKKFPLAVKFYFRFKFKRDWTISG